MSKQTLDLFYAKFLQYCQQKKKKFFLKDYINKEIFVENMKERSMCAQRIVYDVIVYMNQKNQKIHEIDITNDSIKKCKFVCSAYFVDLKS